MACDSLLGNLERDVLFRILDFSAPSSLAHLEEALGVQAAVELRSAGGAPYRAGWLRLLGESAGLWHAAACEDSAKVAEAPPLWLLKRSVPIGRFSRALGGGWHGLGSEELKRGVAVLEKMRSSALQAKQTCEPLLFAHFDVRFNPACKEVLRSFRLDQRRGVVAFSSAATCCVDGAEVPLVLQIRSSPGHQSTGLEIQLDRNRIRIPARGGDNDGLCIRCLIFCGGSHRAITSEYMLRRFDSTGMMPVYRRWHGLYRATSGRPFCSFTAQVDGLLHIARLDLYRCSADGAVAEGAPCWTESSWHVDTLCKSPHLRSAEWNQGLERGTDFARLVCAADNEFAAAAFAPGSLEGSVALVRRGGGIGFAQKALTAREAGAVGCIIYDGEGPLNCYTGPMGLEFQDRVHPDPEIPAVLVDLETGLRLKDALAGPGGAFVRIALDHSKESLRRLPSELETFSELAESGGAIHMAVAIDRAEVE